MKVTKKFTEYLKKGANVALGAGTIVGGAYILSRLKEKQNMETRIERLEQIVEKIGKEEEKGK